MVTCAAAAVLSRGMRHLTLDYLKTESGSGLVLAVAAVAALGLANSTYGGDYFRLMAEPIPVRVGAFQETLNLAGWVRTLLMPVFVLVLAMELKFELLRGELSNPRRLALPALAAVGGFLAPAGVYLALNHGSPDGWLVPTATDGAAALAALAIAGPRLAPSLRVLVMSVAIADNLAAVTLSSVLGASRLDLPMLAGGGAVLAALALLSRWRRAPFLFYAAGFALVWGFTLKSGLDTSLAGVACALAVPIGTRRPGQDSMLKYFMDSLHPYVAFGVLPLFIFTALGISHRAFHLVDLTAPAPLGVILALVIGKPLGVLAFSAAGIALKLARRPLGVPKQDLFGVALLCGVGFTTSYYLAAAGPDGAALRAAILIGSVLAAGAGVLLLSWAQESRTAEAEPV
jgi:NhaA family Na+:H+ antiporter